MPETGHEVDLGQGVAQLVAVALGHAAGHDQAGADAAAVGQIEHGVDRLLAGRLNESARVHDDEVRVVRVRGTAVPLRMEVPLELVGVHLVLRTAQGLQPVPTHDLAHTPRTRPAPVGATVHGRPATADQLSGSPGTSGQTPERRGRDLNPRTRLPRSTH